MTMRGEIVDQGKYGFSATLYHADGSFAGSVIGPRTREEAQQWIDDGIKSYADRPRRNAHPVYDDLIKRGEHAIAAELLRIYPGCDQ